MLLLWTTNSILPVYCMRMQTQGWQPLQKTRRPNAFVHHTAFLAKNVAGDVYRVSAWCRIESVVLIDFKDYDNTSRAS